MLHLSRSFFTAACSPVRPTLPLLTAFAVLATAHARSQEILFESDPSEDVRYVGRLADLDGDGRPEAAMLLIPPAAPQPIIRVLSGLNVLFERTVDQQSIVDLTDAGDVDGDGVRDVLVAWLSPSVHWFFDVASGQDGRWLIQGIPGGDTYESLGDLDGDGRDELLVGSREYTGRITHSEYTVLSVLDQRALHTEVRSGRTTYASSVGRFDDYDQDGLDDYFVTDSLLGVQSFDAADIRIHSSATHAVLQVIRGGYMGRTLRIQDLDGDGTSDFAVDQSRFVDPISSEYISELACFSARRGNLIIRTDPSPWFANSMRAVGDLNGDGVSEVVMSCFDPFDPCPDSQAVFRTDTLERLYRVRDTSSHELQYALAAGDQDQDGFDDLWVLGSDLTRPERGVRLLGGRDTLLSAAVERTSGRIEGADRLATQLTGSEVGAIGRIVLRSISGTPINRPLTPWTPLDPRRTLTFATPYPPSLRGLVVGVQGWTITRGGPRVSAVELVEL